MKENKEILRTCLRAGLWLWPIGFLVCFSLAYWNWDTPKVAYEPPVDGAMLQSYYDKGHAEGYAKGYKEGVKRGFEEGDFNACLTTLKKNQKQLISCLDDRETYFSWTTYVCDRYPNVLGCLE